MPYQINVFNIKVNAITQNASVDFGNTSHNSHTSNFKITGSNASLGDLSPSFSLMGNGFLDPDITDQDQILDPANAFTAQF
ncbi:spore germination protein [Metabacillus sp. GX 13764]|uniref:spore germination protein n=1 Tax=Metabacillus kandeliae TaxID=2900151 RepID=UPI001E3381AA|nr:spore germination protein [Metabacillus kandeliae]MCD7036212.1 spore germination protein [Metabacillus kandeliae]